MPANVAVNSNYEKVRNRTLQAVEETVRKIQASGRTYNTLAELLRDVSVFSGVSRSTLRPYRNADAYHLVARFFGAQAVDPTQVPDEVANEFVLRMKLALVRADNAELARKLQVSEDKLRGIIPAEPGDETLMELYYTMTQFLFRSHGSLRVNEKKGRIEDRFPERGADPVVSSGKTIAQFAAWLRSHPMWGQRAELFT